MSLVTFTCALSCVYTISAAVELSSTKVMASNSAIEAPPYVRNRLARAMYQKMMENEQDTDHSHWYAVDTGKILEPYRKVFFQCDEDQSTKDFLAQSHEISEALFTQLYHHLAKAFLCWFLSNTSINGLLQRGSMFVLSQHQFRSLLQMEPEWKAKSLLDLGAGDGNVTAMMAPHFAQTFATEMSTPMRWRLQQKGYQLLDIEEWSDGSRQYDVISCLNLLDRCDKPAKLLSDMKRVLVPGTGRVLLAVVLPFKPYVEFNKDHKPEQHLHIVGKSFEEQVSHFITDIFEPAGFIVERFTKLPYLCEGDLEHSYYRLTDAVFVLKAA